MPRHDPVPAPWPGADAPVAALRAYVEDRIAARGLDAVSDAPLIAQAGLALLRDVPAAALGTAARLHPHACLRVLGVAPPQEPAHLLGPDQLPPSARGGLSEAVGRHDPDALLLLATALALPSRLAPGTRDPEPACGLAAVVLQLEVADHHEGARGAAPSSVAGAGVAGAGDAGSARGPEGAEADRAWTALLGAWLDAGALVRAVGARTGVPGSDACAAEEARRLAVVDGLLEILARIGERLTAEGPQALAGRLAGLAYDRTPDRGGAL